MNTQDNHTNAATGMLQVYRASAGSGKTFRLAVEYIKLLVENPYNYRHILAVTFTNKATAEMQQRVVSQLYGIAHGLTDSAAYMQAVQSNSAWSEDFIRQQADMALRLMTEDRTRMHIETIDSFFQSVVSELARELNLSPNLIVETSDDDVLAEAVTSLIDDLTDAGQQPLLDAVMAFVNERIDEGQSWHIESDLRTFGKNIFKETYREKKGGAKEDTLREAVEKFRKEYAVMRNAIAQIGNDFKTICTNNGLDEDSLKHYKVLMKFFGTLATGDAPQVNPTIQKKSESEPKDWVKQPTAESVVALQLKPLLQKALAWMEKERKKWRTMKAVRTHLHQLVLIGAVDRKVRQLNDEAGRFLLADTAHFLHGLLKEEDVPFVYERMGGSIIRYIMIDEFQDTSGLQWLNFVPLLQNSLSQGDNCLLVGDVKQSIYRWRNSDWSILNGMENNKEVGTYVKVDPMKMNRRSGEVVVNFAGQFFEQAVRTVCQMYQEKTGKPCDEIDKAYFDVVQEPDDKHKGEGYVSIELVDTEGLKSAESAEQQIEQLAHRIETLLTQGIAQNDIAILVRYTRHIRLICETFGKRLPHVRMVSDEAYRLEASTAVGIIIDAMQLLCTPNDRFAKVQLAYHYQTLMAEVEGTTAVDPHDILHANHEELDACLPQPFIERMDNLVLLPIYELAEQLYGLFGLERLQGQSAYIFTFLDELAAWLDTTAGGLAELITYWAESMHTKCIPNAAAEGIRIMTIHKSKGLEFPTVIVPFCEWELDGRADNLLWCELPTDAEPLSALKLAAVKYSKMRDTYFDQDYAQELLKNYVDNLNLLYVAFTRAKQNLIVMAGEPAKTGKVSALLSTIEMKEYGTLVVSKKKKEEDTENVLLRTPQAVEVQFRQSDSNIEFRQSNNSKKFIAQTDEPDDAAETDDADMYLNEGLLFHYLLSLIHHPDDVEQAIRQMEQEGLFTSARYRDDVCRLVQRTFQHTKAREWFAPHWQVLNEHAILFTDKTGKVIDRRPDRVITDGTRTIVIDYKTGRQSKEHEGQVQRYMNLLVQMGYPNIEGYLWYIRRQDIVPVSLH